MARNPNSIAKEIARELRSGNKLKKYHAVKQSHGWEVCFDETPIALTCYHNWQPDDAGKYAKLIAKALNAYSKPRKP